MSQLENIESRRLLFVCSGNTCRSPIAKALAARLFGENVYVQSVGEDTASGIPATPEAIQALAEEGINLSNHRSLKISELEFSHWDIVVAMTPRIATNIVASNVISAEHLIKWNIDDPYGKGLEAYRNCIKTISKLLPHLSTLLQAEISQNVFLNYLSQTTQIVPLEEYVSNRLARIQSNEIIDRSHFEGIATSALRDFELTLRSELNRILQQNRLIYDVHIRPSLKGEPLFDELTLGKLINCYKTLINKYRIKPLVEFIKGDIKKLIDSELIGQMYSINARRAVLIHKRAITKDEVVELLKDISFVIN